MPNCTMVADRRINLVGGSPWPKKKKKKNFFFIHLLHIIECTEQSFVLVWLTRRPLFWTGLVPLCQVGRGEGGELREWHTNTSNRTYHACICLQNVSNSYKRVWAWMMMQIHIRVYVRVCIHLVLYLVFLCYNRYDTCRQESDHSVFVSIYFFCRDIGFGLDEADERINGCWSGRAEHCVGGRRWG